MTLRADRALPSLRADRLFEAIRGALARGSRDGFRIVQFSVQRDHVHLLVEADRPGALTRGMQGLAIRTAKACNRVLARHGKVWSDRYHARALSTPREVRNALVYILANVKKHLPGARGIDPRSSARWFEGWGRAIDVPPEPPPVVRARTWLARVGWRLHGLIGLEEAPRIDKRACRRPEA